MASRNQSGESAIKQKPAVSDKKFGRNDRVKVLDIQKGEVSEMKFKQAEPLLEKGGYQIVEE